MKTNYRKRITLLIILTFALTACQSNWQIPLSTNGQASGEIDRGEVAFYIEKSLEETESVPLGQLLYHNGFSLIDQIEFTSESGEPKTFVWDEIAETTIISEKGEITVGEQKFEPVCINVATSTLVDEINYRILDIAPTITDALGLPDLPGAQGQVRWSAQGPIDQAVMIFLDGLQYEKLLSLIDQGVLPFFQNLNTIHAGLSVYPPITTSASAALLASTPPQEAGVYGYGYRTTDSPTLFDLAAENNRNIIAVEGASLSFNLRNAETILSGDRDGNGFSDDNVFANSLKVIDSNLPDILYIHFHEIDDMGHAYGPNSTAYESAITRVDQYLSEIYEALPENTLIVIFADHGMHATSDGGNHGTLTAIDMVIPIVFLEK